MAREDNLRPVRTTEEARERGKKGGAASALARKKRKEFRDRLEILLSLPLREGTADDIEMASSVKGLASLNLTALDGLAVVLVKMASKGDREAIRLVLNVLGQLDRKAERTEDQDDGFLDALRASAEDWKEK